LCLKNGDLHFYWKCLMAPLTVIDYIVVHELCHLHHRDHSDAFWNEVDKILPDYRARKGGPRRGAGSLTVFGHSHPNNVLRPAIRWRS